MFDYYDYYLRADSQEIMESRLVGAGLGSFVQINGVTAFVHGEGVVVSHIGPCITGEDIPPAEILMERGKIFIPNIIVKDPRWHTNIRTKVELYEAQKQYLPLIPPPSHPMYRLA